MTTKKRKLLIVDVVSEEAKWSGITEYDKVIQEIQGLQKKHGVVNMGDKVWDIINQVAKAKTPQEARPLIEDAHAAIAGAFYGEQAIKLEKLADFLESRGEIDRAESLLQRAREMRNEPGKFLEETKAKAEKPKKDKTPVFESPAKQAESKKKYSWIIEGSFRQDPEKAGGTIVDIKCNNCGGARTIHLADAFQVKLCLKCR